MPLRAVEINRIVGYYLSWPYTEPRAVFDEGSFLKTYATPLVSQSLGFETTDGARKIRGFGVSKFSPETLYLLSAYVSDVEQCHAFICAEGESGFQTL